MTSTLAPVELKQECYRAYLKGTRLQEICRQFGVSRDTVRQWIQTHGWRKERDALHDDAMEEIEQEMRTTLTKERLTVVKRHLAIASLLEAKIKARLEEMPRMGEGQLLRLAKAFKDSAEVSQKAVGLNQPREGQGIPLILVGLRPSRSDPRRDRERIIDAEVVSSPSALRPAPF